MNPQEICTLSYILRKVIFKDVNVRQIIEESPRISGHADLPFLQIWLNVFVLFHLCNSNTLFEPKNRGYLDKYI